MTDKAAFSATYSDLRFVKSRKIAQVTLEIPIEEAIAFVKAFGTPNPATETWVGIARLDPGKTEPAKAREYAKERRDFSELPPSQRAALLCKTEAFWKFLKVASEDAAARDIRFLCGVASRSSLDIVPEAKRSFEGVEADYQSWLNEPL